MVSYNEWTLSTAPITFNINFNKAVTSIPLDTSSSLQSFELRIYRYVDDGGNTADINDVDITSADSTFTLTPNATSAPTQTLTPTANLPVGRVAAVIWCTNNTPTVTTDDAIYDGDCDTTYQHAPVYFTLNHNTSQITITWNLP